MYSYDRRTATPKSPIVEEMHKGFTQLQIAITTLDQVEFKYNKKLHGDVQRGLKKAVADLEAVAKKLESDEGLQALHEKVEARGGPGKGW